MTLKEIKEAVLAGHTVHWSSDAYSVVHSITPRGRDQWLIWCSTTESGIGLTTSDETTLNGKEEHFYTGD